MSQTRIFNSYIFATQISRPFILQVVKLYQIVKIFGLENLSFWQILISLMDIQGFLQTVIKDNSEKT